MPTIARIGPYRFFFYSDEGREPSHVHVERDACTAKFWLEPIALSSSYGFGAREIRRLHAIIAERHNEFRNAWNEFFRTRS